MVSVAGTPAIKETMTNHRQTAADRGDKNRLLRSSGAIVLKHLSADRIEDTPICHSQSAHCFDWKWLASSCIAAKVIYDIYTSLLLLLLNRYTSIQRSIQICVIPPDVSVNILLVFMLTDPSGGIQIRIEL